jgi:hypothetical protein
MTPELQAAIARCELALAQSDVLGPHFKEQLNIVLAAAKRSVELEQEVVRAEERFIACASHLESPHHMQISEPGEYIFLINVYNDGGHCTMFKKVVKPILAEGESAAYPCREWHEFRKNKKPWPIIPFRSYEEYKALTPKPQGGENPTKDMKGME